jgi:Uncharacterised nucleotidyltransferase
MMLSHKRPEKGILVARILSGAWRPSVPSAIEISEKQLDEITPQLFASGAGAIAWWRIRSTALRETTGGELLQQAYRLQALQASIHEWRISKVFRLLRDAGIEPVLAKGWVAASLYPDPALRPYGDVDLLVRSEQFRDAQTVLATDELSDCWVDLHKEFSELQGRSVNELFERSRLVNLDGQKIRVLGAEDHLALLGIHLLKHGGWRPIWLCDIAVAIENGTGDFNWSVFLGSSRKRGNWLSVSIALAEQLLGATMNGLPDSIRIKLPAWVGKSVISQWSHLFPADHLPVQAPPLMAESLRSPRTIVNAMSQRWPDPITATFNLNGTFGEFPRFGYQLGEFISRAGRFVISRRFNPPFGVRNML